VIFVMPVRLFVIICFAFDVEVSPDVNVRELEVNKIENNERRKTFPQLTSNDTRFVRRYQNFTQLLVVDSALFLVDSAGYRCKEDFGAHLLSTSS
jgi:protein associated with RNAse G/E